MRVTELELRWGVFLLETIFPSGASDRLPIGANGVPLDRFLRDVFARAPALAALGLRVGIFALYWFAPLALGRLGSLRRLPEAERVRALESLAQSDHYVVREVPALLKTIGAMGVFGVPVIQRSIGLPLLDAEPPHWAQTP